MAKQRIALKARHFEDCLNVCRSDAQFTTAFAKLRAIFAECSVAHESDRGPDDVSADDIERELLRAYVSMTVWARMQVLARGRLGEKCVEMPVSAEKGDSQALA